MRNFQMKNYKVIKSEVHSKYRDDRYICIDPETGEVLDDAQGYGYKTPQKAHAAFTWKNRTAKQKKLDSDKQKAISSWRKSHRQFETAVEIWLDDLIHGCYPRDSKFDTKTCKTILQNLNLENSLNGFTASDLSKHVQKHG